MECFAMNETEFRDEHQWIRDELDRCIHFWTKYGIDTVHGGIFTCLDRTGIIYCSDKSVWMQGRCAWIFSFLCSVYGVRQEWLNISRSCLDFMESFCINRDKGNRMYFTVTEDGRPLRQRRYLFSEDFYIMANAEYYANTGDTACIESARAVYDMVWDIVFRGAADPVGLGPKVIPETRRSRSFGDPMIFLNVTAVMRRCDPVRRALYDERAGECAELMCRYHFRPELKCTLETVGINGELQTDTTAGRVVNPGHDIEGSWFLEEEADYENSDALRGCARDMFKFAVTSGWDDKYGGLLYFTDCMGFPPEAYEHDMKLWWPHNELMIASLMFYRDTGDEEYLRWFEKAYSYAREYLSDPEYGEWFGYLRRDGKPTEPPCKGSTFKGPFHVMRSLIMADRLMGEIEAENYHDLSL